jgi:hypothetical protein
MEAAAPRKAIDRINGYMENDRPAARDARALPKTHIVSMPLDPYLSAKMPEGIAPIPKSA